MPIDPPNEMFRLVKRKCPTHTARQSGLNLFRATRLLTTLQALCGPREGAGLSAPNDAVRRRFRFRASSSGLAGGVGRNETQQSIAVLSDAGTRCQWLLLRPPCLLRDGASKVAGGPLLTEVPRWPRPVLRLRRVSALLTNSHSFRIVSI